MRTVALLAGVGVLAGCAISPPPAACADKALRLLEAVPVFGGPTAGAALEGRLEPGRQVHTCEVQGARLRVLVPRAGEAADCTRRAAGRACAQAWIPRAPRTGP